MQIFCGTPAYMSPELCAKNNYQGQATDLWASGILLYTILFGQQPFRSTNEKELFKKIILDQFSMPASTSHSTYTHTNPLRNPNSSAFASKKSVDEMMAKKDQTFDSYRDIKHFAVVNALLEDIMRTEESKRITAEMVLIKYSKWFNAFR